MNSYDHMTASAKEMNSEGREFLEQFVHGVVDFSSQYGSDLSIYYTACNLSGHPSIFPGYGDFPQAFVMRTYGRWWKEMPSYAAEYMPQNDHFPSDDFVEVSFAKDVYPLCVSLYETYNPGALVRIWAKGKSRWHLLSETKPMVTNPCSRIFCPQIRKIDCQINVLRLEFNHDLLNYNTQLDAVTLIGWRGKQSETDVNRDMFSFSPLLCNRKPKQPIIERGLLTAKILASNLLEFVAPFVQKSGVSNTTSDSVLGCLHHLPNEILLLIFSFLDLKSLTRCAQVNKNFNRLAYDPVFYQSLSLKPYWYCVNANALTYLSARCLPLQKLDLSWCGSWPSLQVADIIRFLEENGSTITNLRLNCCKFVDDNVVNCISHSCLSLQELALRGCSGITDFSPLAVLHNLNRLDFYRTKINTIDMVNILWRNPKMEHIDLGDCYQISGMDEVAIVLGEYCLNLQSVNFWRSKTLTASGIMALGSCRQLKEIDLGWCLQLGSSGEWLQSLWNVELKKIFLSTLRGISDFHLIGLINSCPALEQIDLMGLCAITPYICRRILTKCKHLRLLDISFCDQFTSERVKKWRETYPNVQIKCAFQSEFYPGDLLEFI